MTRRDNVELSILAALLLFFCVACHTSGQPWTSRRASELGAFRAKVTDKYDCFGTGWTDARCRPFHRPTDADNENVRLLLSYDYACAVSAEDMVMTPVGNEYVCRWRAPRDVR